MMDWVADIRTTFELTLLRTLQNRPSNNEPGLAANTRRTTSGKGGGGGGGDGGGSDNDALQVACLVRFVGVCLAHCHDVGTVRGAVQRLVSMLPKLTVPWASTEASCWRAHADQFNSTRRAASTDPDDDGNGNGQKLETSNSEACGSAHRVLPHSLVIGSVYRSCTVEVALVDALASVVIGSDGHGEAVTSVIASRLTSYNQQLRQSLDVDVAAAASGGGGCGAGHRGGPRDHHQHGRGGGGGGGGTDRGSSVAGSGRGGGPQTKEGIKRALEQDRAMLRRAAVDRPSVSSSSTAGKPKQGRAGVTRHRDRLAPTALHLHSMTGTLRWILCRTVSARIDYLVCNGGSPDEAHAVAGALMFGSSSVLQQSLSVADAAAALGRVCPLLSLRTVHAVCDLLRVALPSASSPESGGGGEGEDRGRSPRVLCDLLRANTAALLRTLLSYVATALRDCAFYAELAVVGTHEGTSSNAYDVTWAAVNCAVVSHGMCIVGDRCDGSVDVHEDRNSTTKPKPSWLLVWLKLAVVRVLRACHQRVVIRSHHLHDRAVVAAPRRRRSKTLDSIGGVAMRGPPAGGV